MIVLPHISIVISGKRSRKGIENRQNRLIWPLAACLLRMFRAGNRWKTPYRLDPRFKFVTHRVSDEALVQREVLLGKVLSCHAQMGEAQGNADAWKMFRKQNINIQFVYSVSVTDIVGHPVCKKFQPWARSVRCFPTAVHGISWQSIVDGPRWKGFVRLASRNSRAAAVFVR